jgi:hypothetical protein
MRLFAMALLVLGSVGVAQAQETAALKTNDDAKVAGDRTANSARRVTPIHSLSGNGVFFIPAAKPLNALEAPMMPISLAALPDAAEPPAPSPKPVFLYGGRDDYRWQLGLGVDWIRFRSSVFNASAVGIHTSVSYFTNEWFAIEGGASTAFAPEIYSREHVKILVYGAGPKIAWRKKRWEPWAHAIIGGAHEVPNTAGNGKNSFAVQLGGGADYRWNPRLGFRLQGDLARTQFFNQSQNNFQLVGGFVLHL